MSWFDDQIRLRKRLDDEKVEESDLRIDGAVIGRRIYAAYESDRQAAIGALDALLRYFGARKRTVPDKITDLEQQLEYLFQPAGIMRRTVKLKKGWRREAVGAMLCTVKSDGSLAALLPDKLGGYHFYDRRVGRVVKVNKKNERLFDTEALCFYRPLPQRELGFRDVQKFVSDSLSVRDVMLPFAASAVGVLIGMLVIRLLGYVFGSMAASGSLREFLTVGAFLVGASLSMALSVQLGKLLTRRARLKSGAAMEAAAMMRVLNLPSRFVRSCGSGELAFRTRCLSRASDSMVSAVLGLAPALMSLLYLIPMTAHAGQAAGPMYTASAALMLFSAAVGFLKNSAEHRRIKYNAGEQTVSYELIRGVRKIRVSGAEKRAYSRWADAYAKTAEQRYNPRLSLKLSRTVSSGIMLAGLLWTQARAVRDGVSPGDYCAFTAACGLLTGALSSLPETAMRFGEIMPSVEGARPIMEELPETAGDRKVIGQLTGGIELSSLSFRYSDDMPWVLDNVTLKIRPNQFVAVVGESGSGKTALARVLLGLETPQKGAVYYDGKNLSDVELRSLRRRIGAVIENGSIFRGDVFDNISACEPEISIEDAWAAAEAVGLDEDIKDMAHGMKTRITEGRLSGGQRQRLLIARAVAHKPDILILDEATSSLDLPAQKKVLDSLSALNCTRILFTNRLSAIRSCSRIIVLDKGRIAEDGTYAKLIAKRGLFSKLVERQKIVE